MSHMKYLQDAITSAFLGRIESEQAAWTEVRDAYALAMRDAAYEAIGRPWMIRCSPNKAAPARLVLALVERVRAPEEPWQ